MFSPSGYISVGINLVFSPMKGTDFISETQGFVMFWLFLKLLNGQCQWSKWLQLLYKSSASCRILRPTVVSKLKKGSPVTGPMWPRGFQEVQAPRFPWHSAHECGEVVSLTHRSPLTPRRCSWYSFSLRAESTSGPCYDRKEYVTEKSSDTTGNRSRDPPTCSAAP